MNMFRLFVGLLLFLCVVWAVLGPLVSPWIEKRVEWFLLALGAAAVTASWSWSEAVVVEALLRPMKVCGAILAGSLVFSFSHDTLRAVVRRAILRFGSRLAVGLSVVAAGLCATLLTMPVGVLTLVELLRALRLERRAEVHVAVLGCFAVGLGGGLMPSAGPVAAIVMAKLAEAAYAEQLDAWYLLLLVGPWAIPAIVSMGIAAGAFFAVLKPDSEELVEEDPLSLWTVLLLTGKMYVFIAGLVLLGAGLVPFIDEHLLGAPLSLLYWINSLSAVIDNATLVTVEISPRMTQDQIRYILMGVLIAGGALIPGNAPNLIAAHKLKITAREWASVGVPTAAALMIFYFFALYLNTQPA